MTQPGYITSLRQHSDLIASLAERYCDPANGRIGWAQAITDDPPLADKLLVGDGPQSEKIKRLSNAWRAIKKAQAPAPVRRAPVPADPTQPMPLSQRCDLHKAELLAAGADHPSMGGLVNWRAALAAHPELATKLGVDLSATDSRGRQKVINLLGFWYRDRTGRIARGKSSRSGIKQPRPTAKHRVGPFMSKLPVAPAQANGIVVPQLRALMRQLAREAVLEALAEALGDSGKEPSHDR